MRNTILAVLAALAVGGFAGSRLAKANPGDNEFVLEQHDRLVAEAPGCYSTCQSIGIVRRCTVRERECHAVCTSFPECKPDGVKAVRACAVVRERP